MADTISNNMPTPGKDEIPFVKFEKQWDPLNVYQAIQAGYLTKLGANVVEKCFEITDITFYLDTDAAVGNRTMSIFIVKRSILRPYVHTVASYKTGNIAADSLGQISMYRAGLCDANLTPLNGLIGGMVPIHPGFRLTGGDYILAAVDGVPGGAVDLARILVAGKYLNHELGLGSL